jgi:signal transduction histidine kinase
MITRVKKLLAAPIFEDEDKTRAASLLNTILLSVLTTTSLLVPALAIATSARAMVVSDLILGALSFAIFLGLLLLLHRGHVRVAGALLSALLLMLITAAACTFKGLRNPLATAYLVVVAIAALFLGKRAAIIFGLLSILATLGVYCAEVGGAIVFPMPVSIEVTDWVLSCTVLIVGTLLLRFAVGSIAQGFEQAHRNAQALTESNYALQAARDKLARQAQELTRSNVELEQFAYVASHDLQEPLRMVRSYLQLLERRYKGRLDENADEFIHFAVDGATRMQGLINDLLEYSRVGTHGKPFESTDCNVVLEKALMNLQIAIEEADAEITHDDLPTVMGDQVQLAQLLQNLIGNSIKFRQEHTQSQIHVGIGRRDGEWLFSVEDNGIGIDSQYFERVFQIFQRLHSSEEYEGTGIGLAVCKKIVERHGGRIWVESEPGQGSTFYFTVPDRGGIHLE